MERVKIIVFSIFISLFAVNFAHAGEATFSWTMPDPAWEPDPPGTAPAGWIINEVRLYCTILNQQQQPITYNKTGISPDASPLTYTDIPSGEMSCHMTSWSNGDGSMDLESANSPTVTKTITDISSPKPPAIFDFIQAGIRQRMLKNGQQLTSTTTYQIAGQSYAVRCRMSKSAGNQLISVCEDL